MKIRNSETYSAFKKSILKFTRPSLNSIFDCHSHNVIKLIIRLRLGLSHLCENKFRHNFQDTLNPICSCADDIATTIRYLLHFPNYLDERRTFLDNLQSIGKNIHDNSQTSELLLFGVSSNNDVLNTCILNAIIPYILATKRFDAPLTNSFVVWNIQIHIHMLTLPSPKIVLTRFSDNRMFVTFFYYCHYYFRLVFFYLVLLFIKSLYNDPLNF